MAIENFSCSCSNTYRTNSNLLSSFILALVLGVLNLPYGLTHIASVLEDGVPGMPARSIPRGPTVAPAPSPETLDRYEISGRGDDDTRFFNPAEAIRNLLSLSSTTSHHGLHGLKRVSQYHGNGEYGLVGGSASGTFYRPPMSSPQNTWDYEESLHQEDEDGKPTYVPFIGARALTNIPQFFEHLKENIEALKHGHPVMTDNESYNSEDEDDVQTNDGNDFEGALPKKDISSTKPAARRMKTELLVDEKGGETLGRTDNWSAKQGWKPRAAGIVHYYASRPNFLESQQNVLRRANNYNPAWLYTNLGLGKRRR